MGDDRWKYDVPEEGRDEPVTRRPVPQSRQSASERLVRLAKPLLARTGAFARTLPGHAHDLVERIDMPRRSEEHTSELQSLMRISYAVFCLKKKKLLQLKTQQNKPHRHVPQDSGHTKTSE